LNNKSYKNIPHLLLSRAIRQPDKTALAYKKDGNYVTISWKELAESVQRLTQYLISKGVKKGDRIAIISENRPEWVIVDLAVLTCGASLVPLYPQSNVTDIQYVLKHSDSVGLFVSTSLQYEKVREIRDSLQDMKFLIPFDSIPKVDKFADVLADVKLEFSLVEFLKGLEESVGSGDIASVIYTSGTTGPPKGVMLTHRNISVNVSSCTASLPIGENDRFLSFLPLSHVFERTAGYYFALSRGAEVYYAESIATVPQNMKEIHPTIVCSVPRLYEKIYAGFHDKLQTAFPLKRLLVLLAMDVGRAKYILERRKKKIPPWIKFLSALFNILVYKKVRQLLGGRLRFFISGGAPLPREIAEFFYKVGVLIVEGYGLTETAPVLSVNRLDRFKFGTVGSPVEGVELKITDDGEIVVRGENIMKGYYKNPEATQEMIKDGWLYTGDVGFFDGEGFLRITDRKKDIIVTAGGKNISPQNIEQSIIGDKYISQILVIGDKKPYLTALVVPSIDELGTYADFKRIDYQNTEELIALNEIRSLVERRIAGRIKDFSKAEQIQYIRLLPEEFTLEKGELTPTLKIRRRIIMKKYKNIVDELYDEKSNRIRISF
jgi:long-chain acyl-CoA synthetase